MAKCQMSEAVKTLHGRLFSSQFVRCFLWRRTTPPGNGSVPEHPKDSRLFQSRKKEGVALPLFVSKPQRLTAGDEDGGWCRPICAKQDYLFSSMFGGQSSSVVREIVKLWFKRSDIMLEKGFGLRCLEKKTFLNGSSAVTRGLRSCQAAS